MKRKETTFPEMVYYYGSVEKAIDALNKQVEEYANQICVHCSHKRDFHYRRTSKCKILKCKCKRFRKKKECEKK